MAQYNTTLSSQIVLGLVTSKGNQRMQMMQYPYFETFKFLC